MKIVLVKMIEITINESRQLQIDMLSALHAFCEENHLKYYIFFGTLLGAVRHKGFIPWDDDVDIVMFRSDYEFLRENFSHRYFYVNDCEIDDKYYLPMAKMIDSRTLLIEDVDSKESIGVYIDLFVLDAYSQNEIRNRMFITEELFLRNLYSIKVMPGSSRRKGIKRLLHAVLFRSLRNLNLNKISKRMNYIAKNLNTSDNDEPSEYGIMATSIAYPIVLRFKSEWFKETIDVSFENKLFCAPASYHEILICLYGNYMQLPPVSQRVRSCFHSDII